PSPQHEGDVGANLDRDDQQHGSNRHGNAHQAVAGEENDQLSRDRSPAKLEKPPQVEGLNCAHTLRLDSTDSVRRRATYHCRWPKVQCDPGLARRWLLAASRDSALVA